MNDEEIAAMKARNAELEANATKDKATITGLEGDITSKDQIIKDKTQDVVGARRKYKTLGEMSDEEKSGLSEDEIKTKEASDEIVERQEASEKIAADDRASDVASRRSSAISKLSGGDAELEAKLNANFDLLKGSDGAYTEEEIGGFVGTAASMMGPDAPNPVNQNGNDNGGAPLPKDQGQPDFADSEGGKTLSAQMGIAEPEASN